MLDIKVLDHLIIGQQRYVSLKERGLGFGDERLTAALLDRLTHYCHIVEFRGESFRFKQSLKQRMEQP